MPYSTALDEYSNYEGWSQPPMARTTSTLELLLNIHQLARSLTLAAGDPNIGESTYQRVRDKILSLIPTLIDSVFFAERQAKHLGENKLEALGVEPRINRFADFHGLWAADVANGGVGDPDHVGGHPGTEIRI